MTSQNEIERRYHNIRAAMAAEKVDALIVCGNQYTGFAGAVRYTSGFEIVHRYVSSLIPLAGDPSLVFPARGVWVVFFRGGRGGSATRKRPGSREKSGQKSPASCCVNKFKNTIGSAL